MTFGCVNADEGTLNERLVLMTLIPILAAATGTFLAKLQTKGPKGAREMARTAESAKPAQVRQAEKHRFVQAVHGIRYQVKDAARSVAFYTTHLGFALEYQHLPAFVSLSLGDSHLLLSGPQASGSRPMPNGERQEPGGWNRVVLRVVDLDGFITVLENAGLQFRFRNTPETGPRGRQIQIEDPDGNPIELFEPAH
jgi:glyoxylase I family protein